MQLRKTVGDFFWRRVNKTPGCWLWTGNKDSFGYGLVQLGRNEPRTGAHRVSWEIHFSQLPKEIDNKRGLCVLHRCDNPSCVRPDHLFLGTRRDNLLDAFAKGRHKAPSMERLSSRTECPSGHPFDESNTYLFRNKRLCKACRAVNQRQYVKRKNAHTIYSL